MRKFYPIYIIIFICLSLFYVSTFAQESKEGFPTIDGKIEPGEWDDATVFDNFYMMIPRSDEKYYDSTIVYIKQSSTALYFAFKYYPKGKVISKSLTRDRSTEDENEFFILLDLENKRQNGYIFVFSFLNNQRDQLVYNQRNKSSEWDWKWYVQSTIYKEAKNGEPGYIETEVMIPVDRLQNKNKKKIGIDLQLFAYKPDGGYYYYSLIPDSELLSVEKLYEFTLKQPFEEKLDVKFEAVPYLRADAFNDSSANAQFGGEFNMSIDKHKLKGTYQTDESTLEADPFTFNFNRSTTFLEERRPFFSKDLDLYSSPINLFYTRSIKDILYGFNYTYRSDRLKGGAIFVQEDQNLSGRDRKVLFMRPFYETNEFKIGSMFIYSDNATTDYNENIISGDFFYRFPQNRFRFGGQFAHSNSSQSGTDDNGNSIDIYGYYQYNDNGGPYADYGYNRTDEGFRASTSFNSQTGLLSDYENYYLSGGYNFVFDRKYFTDMNFSGGYSRANTISDGFIYRNRYYVNTNVKASEWLRLYQYFEYNRPNDYDENGQLITRTNTLQEYGVSLFFGTNYFNVGYFFGPYYGSFLANPYMNFNVFFFEKVGFRGGVQYIDDGYNKGMIMNTRLDYKVFDKLYLRSFFQRDNISDQSLWNLLAQYEFFGGSNIYLVINLIGDHLQQTNRYFKVSYQFDF